MKKLMMAAIAILSLASVGYSQATPNKFGYFDLESVLSLMPGIEKVDSLVDKFQRDTLDPEYQFELSELNRMDSVLKADSGTSKMPPRIYQMEMQRQAERFYKLQNWQQYTQQVLQAKQQELMQPYLSRVFEALQAVINEGKYTYVFKRETLWQAPPADNLVIPVAKKLGLKLPPELSGQQDKPASKPAAGGRPNN
jgi:Skp family chaperone for outer membrane proteins